MLSAHLRARLTSALESVGSAGGALEGCETWGTLARLFSCSGSASIGSAGVGCPVLGLLACAKWRMPDPDRGASVSGLGSWLRSSAVLSAAGTPCQATQ